MAAPNVAAAPPVFLDRDGTLIVERHYLSDPAEVRLERGVVEGLRTLTSHGHALIVLTNQSGIGRGKFDQATAERVNARVAQLLGGFGIEVLAWYICPHTPEAGCACRKPRPGMALAAARDWSLNLSGSYVIGDKRADVELADAIGAHGILVLTGQGGESREWAMSGSRLVFGGLADAADYITRAERRARVSTP